MACGWWNVKERSGRGVVLASQPPQPDPWELLPCSTWPPSRRERDSDVTG